MEEKKNCGQTPCGITERRMVLLENTVVRQIKDMDCMEERVEEIEDELINVNDNIDTLFSRVVKLEQRDEKTSQPLDDAKGDENVQCKLPEDVKDLLRQIRNYDCNDIESCSKCQIRSCFGFCVSLSAKNLLEKYEVQI